MLPDAMNTLGSHLVYIRGIYQLKHLSFNLKRWDPKVCMASGNANVNIGLKMTRLQSKHVALYYVI